MTFQPLRTLLVCAVVSAVNLSSAHAGERPSGAEVPWVTYEAEEMKTNGEVLGPRYEAFSIERESSGQRCVRLTAGQVVEFDAKSSGNALVIRYSLPDSPEGVGLDG